MREANDCHRLLVPLILVALLVTACGGPRTPATPAPSPADAPPPQPAGSWSDEIDFDHLSLEDGLSQVTVTAILQDAQGFIWFGTQDGLNKYDGYSFTVYRPTPGENSLAESYVRAIYQDAAGMLWVGTEGGGLDRFDRDQERFTHYRFDPDDANSLSNDYVCAIAPGARGELWIAKAACG